MAGKAVPLLSAAVLLVASVCGFWLREISSIVLDPYLDEVFHVRQAQVYCAGDFHVWDPKITTPPGVYLLSYLVYLITGRCDIQTLRALNCSAICAIAVLSFDLRRRIRRQELQKRGRAQETDDTSGQIGFIDVHSAVNISLFPPLFFFSALYYTDITSTLCVLLSYRFFLQSQDPASNTVVSTTLAVISGIVALLFRQTNIFWVALFPAALAVVGCLERSPSTTSDDYDETNGSSFLNIITKSWQTCQIYDCTVEDAYFEDYLKASLSIGVAALRNITRIVLAVAPYVFVLGLFGAFVLWNGGVVLGDKSNHIATLHFPQMLYIWPYIFFFSFPLILTLMLGSIVARLPSVGPIALLQHLFPFPYNDLPRPHLIVAFIFLGLAAVHYNTIIHPFTLADNRHYVFYVFRILRRHPAIKYIALPIYIKCGWVIIRALGNKRGSTVAFSKPSEKAAGGGSPSKNPPQHGCRVSFVIVWLATTMLSIVTAPLVEPRYFIIPWIMWRLHVLNFTAVANDPKSKGKKKQDPKGILDTVLYSHDNRLYLETTWFLLVNAITGYIFLERGFSWPQEPGKVQRFMW